MTQRYDDEAVCPMPPQLAVPMTKMHLELGEKLRAGGASGKELQKLYLQVKRLATLVRIEQMRRVGAV